MTQIIAVGYLVGLIVCARWLVPRVLDWMASEDPDTADTVVSRALALFVAIFWPLILFTALATWKVSKSDGQLKAELKERDERIRQLEHELGMKETP